MKLGTTAETLELVMSEMRAHDVRLACVLNEHHDTLLVVAQKDMIGILQRVVRMLVEQGALSDPYEFVPKQ